MGAFRSEPLGILYAEDFGADEALLQARPQQELVPLTQADVDMAVDAAIHAARAAWAQVAAERRTVALECLAAGLAEARVEARAEAEALAEGVARTALAMLAGALPHFCRAHGDAEVQALLRTLLPLLAGPERVVVRVHASLVEALQADLDNVAEDLGDHVELRPANLPPGDVRLSWTDGSLVRDAAAICAAMEQSLERLGLSAPSDAHHPRCLALAE